MQFTRRTILSGMGGMLAAPLAGGHSAYSAGIPTQAMRDMTEKFRISQSIPGFSIAIARGGKFIFNEAFGSADTASAKPVTRASRFRIASVSKPITSVAIFKLVEAGKIKLSDKVFGPGSIFGNKYGTAPLPARIRAVTVDHLLTHTAGGWQNDGTDPMFLFAGLSKTDLLDAVLNQRTLDYDPGTHYAYSNFGYFVLGRIIEKVSGKRYDKFVQQTVLGPAGVDDMIIGGNDPMAKAKNEVTYYPWDEGSPYAFDLARMDSHGGWIANPADLVRFMLHYDGFATVTDELKPKSIKSMITPSSANQNYAHGWAVNSLGNWWHNGSLPGTSSLLVRASNGFCWAALANTRNPHSDTGYYMDVFVWDLLRNNGLI